jgi:NAD(P)-dependent dehydrogenase (short-subunit alcohol dehydrogenase family)
MIDYQKKFRLDEKIAFVIGGMGLIGREISMAFASSGAKTYVFDLEKKQTVAFEKKSRDLGNELFFKPFDIADMERLEENFLRYLEEIGCPDIFINCSYPMTKDYGNSSFRNVTLSSFKENVDIHMNSYSWLAHLAAKAMVKRRMGGNIIQLGSIYGLVGQDQMVYKDTDMHENMTYAAIKGGITNLTRQMASYFGQFNIRVNTLSPGGLVGHVAGKSDTQNPNFVKQYSEKTPLKRLGSAEEVASTALFLASEASSYITGATIMVDGGWTAI